MNEKIKDAYAGVAERYAASVDAKPWNAFYERPALLSLLPPLAGKKVLDAGCGSGWYAEYLLNQGATVIAFDQNPTFVELTRNRVRDRALVFQADLRQGLPMVADASCDIVICPLVMHYIYDWAPAFAAFHRALRPAGLLVFSTHHPFMDWHKFDQEDYFATSLLEEEWEDVGAMQFYHRPLTDMCEALWQAGFVIERLIEPRPTEDFARINPIAYKKLCSSPGFLVIRARKDLLSGGGR